MSDKAPAAPAAPRDLAMCRKYKALMKYVSLNLPEDVYNSGECEAIINIPMMISLGKTGGKYKFNIDVIDDVAKLVANGKDKSPYNKDCRCTYARMLNQISDYAEKSVTFSENVVSKKVDIRFYVKVKVHPKNPSIRTVNVIRIVPHDGNLMPLPSEVPTEPK